MPSHLTGTLPGAGGASFRSCLQNEQEENRKTSPHPRIKNYMQTHACLLRRRLQPCVHGASTGHGEARGDVFTPDKNPGTESTLPGVISGPLAGKAV